MEKVRRLILRPYFIAGVLVSIFFPIFFTLSFGIKWGSIVLGDELIFARQIALVDPSLASYSNQFYIWLYSAWDGLFNDVVLSATLLNGVFAIGSNLVIFAIALKFLKPWASVAAVGASAGSTIWISTAYVMPEAPYAFLAILAFAIFLNLYSRGFKGFVGPVAFALVFSLATLTKPHAWALLLAVVLAALVPRSSEPRPWKPVLNLILLTLGMRIFIGLGLGGLGSLNLLGGYALAIFPEYIFSPASPKLTLVEFTESLPLGLEVLVANLLPYIATYVILFGFLWWGALPQSRYGKIFFSLSRSYSIILTAGALLFSLYVSVSGDDHSQRILARYFEFLFLFSLVGVLYFASTNGASNFKRVFTVAIAQMVSVLYISRVSGLSFSSADSLILSYLTGYDWAFISWIALIAGLAVSSSAFSQAAKSVAVIVLLSFWGVIQVFSWSNFDAQRVQIDSALEDLAVVESMCNQSPHEKIFFVSDTGLLAGRAQLDLGYLDSAYAAIPENVGLSEEFKLPDGYSCAIFLGEYAFAPALNPFYLEKDLAAIRPFEEFQGPRPWDTDRYEVMQKGLMTSWGFWADGNRLEIIFKEEIKDGDEVTFEVALGEGAASPEIEVELAGKLSTINLEEVGFIYKITIVVPSDGARSLAISTSPSGDDGLGAQFPSWLQTTHIIGLGSITVSR
jgi:hypothetical protein